MLYIIVLLSLATIAFPFVLFAILLGSTQNPRICVVGQQVVHWSNNIITLKLFFHQAIYSSIYFGCIIWCQNENSHIVNFFCFDEMQVVPMGQLWQTICESTMQKLVLNEQKFHKSKDPKLVNQVYIMDIAWVDST